MSRGELRGGNAERCGTGVREEEEEEETKKKKKKQRRWQKSGARKDGSAEGQKWSARWRGTGLITFGDAIKQEPSLTCWRGCSVFKTESFSRCCRLQPSTFRSTIQLHFTGLEYFFEHFKSS